MGLGMWFGELSAPMQATLRWSLIVGTVVPTATAVLELLRRALGIRVPPPTRELARMRATAIAPESPALILGTLATDLRLLDERHRGLPRLRADVEAARASGDEREMRRCTELLAPQLDAATAASRRFVRVGLVTAATAAVAVALVLWRS